MIITNTCPCGYEFRNKLPHPYVENHIGMLEKCDMCLAHVEEIAIHVEATQCERILMNPPNFVESLRNIDNNT